MQYVLVLAAFALGGAAENDTILNAGNLNPDGWVFVGGDWSVTEAGLRQSDPRPVAYAFHPGAILGSASVQARFRVSSPGPGVQTAGLVLCSQDSRHGYFAHFDTKNDQVILFKGDLHQAANEITRRREIPMNSDTWYTARASVKEGRVRVFLDGKEVLTVEDTNYAAGVAGVYTSQGAAEFEGLEVRGTKAVLAKPWKKASLQQSVPAKQTLATILSIGAVCKEPGRYIGWPSIAKAPNGDLIAVFSGDRTAHISPEGVVQMVRSRDGGKTWDSPETVFDSPIDDRDAGIIRTRKDTMLVSWFTNPGGGEWQGHWTIRSADNGHTWAKPVRTTVTTPHGPIQLKDGRLLYVGQRPHESHGPDYDVGIQESRDDGRSWKTIGTFPVLKDVPILSFDECHVVECASGKLVILFRDCSKPHYMRQSESTDGGKTWAAPHITRILGYPPHVLKLPNDWLMTVYAKRWDPRGQYACISRDEGKTWDTENEIKLAAAFDGDIGYPASVQLDDGTFWTVYYQSEYPGEKPCLMGTHWKLHIDTPAQ